MRLHIAKMACGGCVKSVTEAVQKLDPAARVQADLSARIVSVESRAPQAALEKALATAGYPATAVASA